MIVKVDKIADFARQNFCFLSKHFLVHIAHRNLNERLQEEFAFEKTLQKTLAIAELTC